MNESIENTRKSRESDIKAGRTIFHAILESKLPAEDLVTKRLADEAFGVVGAGITTVAFSLMVSTFYIINTPRIYRRLKEELALAFPNKDAFPDLLEFEKLPYLKACIQEGVRLSHGITARNPRMHDQPYQYKEWTIPAYTLVSMSATDINLDEKIFPSPSSFMPERWLDNARAPDGQPLDHYLMSWGKGPRACLGIK